MLKKQYSGMDIWAFAQRTVSCLSVNYKLLLCGCCVWQGCQPLYGGPVPYPIYHSLTPHCAFLWESLWQMRSFANASAKPGDCKWSDMKYVTQRGLRIIKSCNTAQTSPTFSPSTYISSSDYCGVCVLLYSYIERTCVDSISLQILYPNRLVF